MLVFLALVLTADLYFAPAVANIARWMDLSEDVAGATLLAFGNGAPDFFTQVAAITYGENVDLLLALGEGIGAGVYVSCFCLACSLLAAKADPVTGVVVQVPRLPFLRDAVTYLAGLVMALLAVRDHVFTRPEAASMLLLYTMYVVTVLYGSRLADLVHPGGGSHRGGAFVEGGAEHAVHLGLVSDRPEAAPELELIAAHTSAMRHRQQALDVGAAADASSPASPRLLKSSTAPAAAPPVQTGTAGGSAGPSSPRGLLPPNHDREESLPPPESLWRQLVTWLAQSIGRSARAARSDAGDVEGIDSHAVGDAEAEPEPFSWAWIQPLSIPVKLCLALTMADPRHGAPRVSQVHAMLIAVFMPPLLGMVLGASLPPSPALHIASIIFRCLLVLACAAKFPSRGIPGADSALVSGIAFVSGLAWMDLCADEVVAIFQSLGRILNFPEDLLGGTIMCWAASVGDLVGMLAVVRQGHVQMVVTSCLAGPIFQLLAGLGIGMLIADTDAGSASAVTLDTELRVLFGFGVSVLVGAYILAVPLFYKCALTRRFAALMMALYVGFVAVYTTIGLQPVRGRRR
jgi:sodium/potassium/calcium exchanger 6